MTRSENFILDFTHIYIDENIEQTENIVRIDCSDILETDLYCTKEGEAEIQKRIENFSINGVHFIDSGNYHYITKIMTDKINKKFSLVLYDHHTDMQKPMVEGMTSCGDWAAQVIEQNENLEQLILVGASEADIQQINVKNQSKLITFSAEELRNNSGREKLDLIETDVPFYISIDKDVLCETDADTNWSQGDMRLSTMLECLGAVKEKCAERISRILGVDICGECDVTEPGNSALNDMANAALLEFFTSTDVGEDIEENKNGTTGGNG